MNNFTPVLIPTLCRQNHFKRCIESLSRCTNANNTDLIIALDYPRNQSHKDGYQIIKEYIKTINGFKSVQVYQRTENFGAIKNTFDSIEEVFETYDRIIYTEDDNEFSPCFLDYMNKGLDIFRENKTIMAISGYNYPIEMPTSFKKNHYFTNRFTAWGVGLWKEKYIELLNKSSFENTKIILANPYKVYKLFRHRKFLLNELLKFLERKEFIADVFFETFLYLNNHYTVLPIISLVRNYGADGSGVNGGNLGIINKFNTQSLDANRQFDFNENTQIELERNIEIELAHYYKVSLKGQIGLLKKIIFYWLTHTKE